MLLSFQKHIDQIKKYTGPNTCTLETCNILLRPRKNALAAIEVSFLNVDMAQKTEKTGNLVLDKVLNKKQAGNLLHIIGFMSGNSSLKAMIKIHTPCSQEKQGLV